MVVVILKMPQFHNCENRAIVSIWRLQRDRESHLVLKNPIIFRIKPFYGMFCCLIQYEINK